MLAQSPAYFVDVIAGPVAAYGPRIIQRELEQWAHL
jgi:hypothetical protein